MNSKLTICAVLFTGLMILCSVFVAGCISSEQDKIIGTWTSNIPGATSTLKFNQDGTGTMTASIDGYENMALTSPIKWEHRNDGYYAAIGDNAEMKKMSTEIIVGELKSSMKFDSVDYTKVNN